MKIKVFKPSKEDKERNLHFVTATKCYKSADGIYLIFLIEGKIYRHLKVTREDGKPIHNFMDIQEIKNLVFGTDCIAVEIYPKQRDFINGSNTYHLWTWDGIIVPNLKELPRYH
jgi:hypothetical protein